MIYTVTFNPALDYTLWADGISKGGVIRMEKQEIFCGGKGINVSLVLKELGFESIALGFVAGFTGQEVLRRLDEVGIQSDFICLKNGYTRINVKIKSEPEVDLNAAGPDIDGESLKCLFEQLCAMKDGDCLVLAGSIPKTLPDNIYEQIMEKLSGKDIKIIVDATGKLLGNVLKYRPFLIKPNNFELEELVGRKLPDDQAIAEAAMELQQKGAVNVLVSLGGDGALLVDEYGKVSRIGVAPCEMVNSVGAGDSMVAGFLAGYLKTGDYAYALKLGTASGGATANSEGLAKRERIESLLNLI